MLGSIALVAVILFFLRTNTAIVFLSLCAGSVLLNATGAEASLVASSLSSGSAVSTDITKIALLTAPAIITAIVLRKHVKGARALVGFIAGMCAGLLGAALVVPLLSSTLQAQIGSTESWDLLTAYQSTVITVGMVASIGTLAFTVAKPHAKPGRKKSH